MLTRRCSDGPASAPAAVEMSAATTTPAASASSAATRVVAAANSASAAATSALAAATLASAALSALAADIAPRSRRRLGEEWAVERWFFAELGENESVRVERLERTPFIRIDGSVLV